MTIFFAVLAFIVVVYFVLDIFAKWSLKGLSHESDDEGDEWRQDSEKKE